MPASYLLAIPYLLAAVAALFLSGLSARLGIIGVTLVAIATAAAARVTEGTPSFHQINGALLYGGLLLFAVAVFLALKGAKLVSAGTMPPPPPSGTGSGSTVLRRWGMAVLLGALLLPSLWFVITVAGPDARSLQGLRDAPFSSAGETLLAALLLPASLVLAGVWPFGHIANSPRFAPLGALLLAGVVVPMVGDGLEHWRSPYVGWLVLGAFVAAFRGDWPRLMACAGLFAIACGNEPVLWAGPALTIVASLLSLRPSTSGWLLRLAYFAAGACGIAALRETVANEVVYSVLLLIGVVIATLRTPLRAAGTGQ